MQAKADAIEALAEFAEPARSKPLFLFLKGGKEVGRMDGANPVELGKLVTKNATKKRVWPTQPCATDGCPNRFAKHMAQGPRRRAQDPRKDAQSPRKGVTCPHGLSLQGAPPPRPPGGL